MNNRINGADIDTCYTEDQGYETCIFCPDYDGGAGGVVVQLYENKEDAIAGHKRWIAIFNKQKPLYLKEWTSAAMIKLMELYPDMDIDNLWRIHRLVK